VKFNKPRIVTAYKSVIDKDLYICGSEKAVRGWMAEQGDSPRIMKVQLAVQRKSNKKKVV
jgi:hypothetical protein